jgi:hypothetical protein
LDLPSDTDQHMLKDYMERFGETVSVELMHACSDLVTLMEDRREVEYDLCMAMAMLKRSGEVRVKIA